jgi:hypothetical protein
MEGETHPPRSREKLTMAEDSSPEQMAFSVVERELRLRRAAHPNATPFEIEPTLDARLRGARGVAGRGGRGRTR